MFNSFTDCDWPTMNHSVDCYANEPNYLLILIPLVAIAFVLLLLTVKVEDK